MTYQDNLAADVPVESERRLKAEEAELERALLNRQEKKLADRYHSAKFFGALETFHLRSQ